MNFFRKYRGDIDDLLNELKGNNSEKKISAPEDLVSKVMKSLDDTSKNSRNIMVRLLAFILLVFVTIFSVIFFGENMNAYKIWGILFIIIGIFVISKGM